MIKEAIAIHGYKERAMNRDTRSYFLSSTYDKLLLRNWARFHQNDTSQRRVNTFLRKTSADVKTSIWVIKVRNSISFIVTGFVQTVEYCFSGLSRTCKDHIPGFSRTHKTCFQVLSRINLVHKHGCTSCRKTDFGRDWFVSHSVIVRAKEYLTKYNSVSYWPKRP